MQAPGSVTPARARELLLSTMASMAGVSGSRLHAQRSTIPGRRLATLIDACVRRATTITVLLASVAAAPALARAQPVHLSWDPPEPITDVSYVVEWGLAPRTYVASAPVPRGVTSLEVGGLRPGLRYYFTVRAVDAHGLRSGPSNEVSAIAQSAQQTGGTGVGAPGDWPDVALTVRRGGTGAGTVVSAPVGIACGTSCTASLPQGTRVILAATAAPGSRFKGWQGGACAGDGTCAFDLGEQMTVSAIFEIGGDTAATYTRYLAEGAVSAFFDLFLLLANPGARAADVRVTYLLPDGTRVRRTHHVGPSQRYTIWVDQEGGPLVDTAVSAIVESTNGVPIVAERSMWWPGDSGTWAEAHNSAGASVTGTRWAVADGNVRSGANTRSTYLLVANPTDDEARIRITLLLQDGLPAISREFTVIPGSRFGLSVGDAFPEAVGERFGALVESLGTAPVPIVVERAMYADAPGQPWASGTNVLATRLE